jgi:hypothetical protein
MKGEIYMNAETRLYDEIETLNDKLLTLTPGTDEYDKVFKEYTALLDRAIELYRIEADTEDKAAARESAQALELQKARGEKGNRIVQAVINVAGIVLPVILTVWGTNKSLKFEEEGTVTTTAGRNFMSRLFRK